jgi:hypothetical protein
MILHLRAYRLKKTKRSISDTRMLLGYTGSSPLEPAVWAANSLLMEFFRIILSFFKLVKVFSEVADKPLW